MNRLVNKNKFVNIIEKTDGLNHVIMGYQHIILNQMEEQVVDLKTYKSKKIALKKANEFLTK